MLHTGETGAVKEVDEDGNILVPFGAGIQWVTKRNLSNLQVVPPEAQLPAEPVADKQDQRIQHLFEALDTKKQGRLGEGALYVYAVCCGYDGTKEGWSKNSLVSACITIGNMMARI